MLRLLRPASIALGARKTSLFRPNGPVYRALRQQRRLASSAPGSYASTTDPTHSTALKLLEEGTTKLESGDIPGAKSLYQQALDIKKTAGGLFNLGVVCFHLKEYDQAIVAWKESIELHPKSADAHMNLASAYVVIPTPRPDLALEHLHIAAALEPTEPEIAFNLAAVLEACDKLEEALEQYKISKKYGVEKADMHIRNVSAKILGRKMKQAEQQEKEKEKEKS